MRRNPFLLWIAGAPNHFGNGIIRLSFLSHSSGLRYPKINYFCLPVLYRLLGKDHGYKLPQTVLTLDVYELALCEVSQGC